MKPSNRTYLSNRVLKINVGFLLAEGPGNSQDSFLDIPDPVRVDDDLIVHYIRGDLRLSRMKEGILVQAQFNVGVDNECSRCLTGIEQSLDIDLEELYAHPQPRNTEFFVGGDCILDLAPLLRAEVLMAKADRVLCQDACQGLCPNCGANRNAQDCDCEIDNIDPRMAKLKELLK